MREELFKKTSEIILEYYKQEVPFLDEKEKYLWLETLPKNISLKFADYTLDKLMLNIPFLAYYMPKYVGSINDFVIKELNENEGKEYILFIDKLKKGLNDT